MARTRSRRPTSRDVAERAGVSLAAVSRAFAEGGSIAPETRERVMAAAHEIGYRPSALPRMLQTDRSNLIALIIGEITNPFYPDVMAMLLPSLRAAGLHPLVFVVDPGEIADDVLEEVFRFRVDGVVVMSATLSAERARELGRHLIPVVLMNRHVADEAVLSVACDNTAAGREVADLLLDAGHRQPALIAGDPLDMTEQAREEGFVGRLRERGIAAVPRHVGENSYSDGAMGIRRLFAAGPRPDAVFCLSDIIALGAIDALRYDLGLRVPEDVSLVGFDNVPAARWGAYRLTTIAQPRAEMVAEAVRMLLGAIAGAPRTASPKLLPGHLVRGTTARLPPG